MQINVPQNTLWKTLPYTMLTPSQVADLGYKQDQKGKEDGLKVTEDMSQG